MGAQNWAYESNSHWVFACTTSVAISTGKHAKPSELPCTGKGGSTLPTGEAPYWLYVHPVVVPSVVSTHSTWYFDHKICL